jgi:hypothetical protein
LRLPRCSPWREVAPSPREIEIPSPFCEFSRLCKAENFPSGLAGARRSSPPTTFANGWIGRDRPDRRRSRASSSESARSVPPTCEWSPPQAARRVGSLRRHGNTVTPIAFFQKRYLRNIDAALPGSAQFFSCRHRASAALAYFLRPGMAVSARLFSGNSQIGMNKLKHPMLKNFKFLAEFVGWRRAMSVFKFFFVIAFAVLPPGLALADACMSEKFCKSCSSHGGTCATAGALEVDETGELSAAGTRAVGIGGPNLFTLGLRATLSSQATRTDKYYSYFSLVQLKQPLTPPDTSCIQYDISGKAVELSHDGSSPLIS